LLSIHRGARRQVDVEEGLGVDRKQQVFTDKKKKENKIHCRIKKLDETNNK
jgi:hypothetical protein